MSAAKGSRYERQLVTILHDQGYGVSRTPSSGSASDRDLPDILAGEPVFESDSYVGVPKSRPWAIELKVGDQTTLYVEEYEVDALRSFANRFGAQPYLVARYTSHDSPTSYFFVKPDRARITDGGRYGLPVDDITERAIEVIHKDDESSE